jgi:L,D-peptidoglycan transpeptidase YkuD (ErfK/YbiS/YcfS/YnhG family)
MEIVVSPRGTLSYDGSTVRCALGRGGVRPDKAEGDGATPVGCYALRRVLYRPDRVSRPETRLPVAAIGQRDGWCDAPEDTRYNRPVILPYPASAETLWREDGLYDLLVVLGHNDDPPVPGRGSAIFWHVARPGFGPTEGCVAITLCALRDALKVCDTGDVLCVTAPDADRK